MDNHEALKILTEHNQWRRGETDVREYGVEKLGEAIDTAISVLSRADGEGSIKPTPSIPSHYGNSVAGDSSLPAPTQDGTAEERTDELDLALDYLKTDGVRNDFFQDNGMVAYIAAHLANYAAPLRAEIERLKKDLEFIKLAKLK